MRLILETLPNALWKSIFENLRGSSLYTCLDYFRTRMRINGFFKENAHIGGLMQGCVAVSRYQSFVPVINRMQIDYLFLLIQFSVDLATGISWLGLGGTLPMGIFLQKYGARAGAVVAILLGSGAHFLLWSSSRHTEFYNRHQGLLCLYFFVAGNFFLQRNIFIRENHCIP